jgi:hypothetical protein
MHRYPERASLSLHLPSYNNLFLCNLLRNILFNINRLILHNRWHGHYKCVLHSKALSTLYGRINLSK